MHRSRYIAFISGRGAIGAFTTLLALVGAGSFAYLGLVEAPMARAQAIHDRGAQLAAMADDREEAIEWWARHTAADARTVAKYPTVIYHVTGQEGPPYPFDPELGPQRSAWELIEAFRVTHTYLGAHVFKAADRSWIHSGRTPDAGPRALLAEVAEEVVASGAPALRIDRGSRTVIMAAPVGEAGAVVLEGDAMEFVYPLLLAEPEATRTGETYLVMKQPDGVAFLSPAPKTSAAPERLRTDSLFVHEVVSAGRGAGGALVLGPEVLAAIRPIESTPWWLVVRFDRAEALGTHRSELARLSLAFLGLFLGLFGIAFGSWRTVRSRYVAAVTRERLRFAALLEHTNDSILFLDADGRVRDANRRAEEFYGVAAGGLSGMHAGELQPPELRGQWSPMPGGPGEETALIETEHLGADGERIPVEISSRTVELEDEITTIAIVRDVTNRSEQERALRAAEERYRAIVENSPDVIGRIGPDLRYLYLSPSARAMEALPADALPGLAHPETGLPPADSEEWGRVVRGVFATGRGHEQELVLEGSEDVERHFEWRLFPELAPGGEVLTVVSLLREITGQRALEHQLRHSQKMEAVGRLAGGVAHDFNNVLTSIGGHAALALEALEPDSPVRDDLSEIVRSADRAAALIRQLLAFSRRQIMQPRVVDVGAVIRSMEKMIRRLIGEHIALRVEVRHPDPKVLADPSQIEQVLLNLSVNARDAMPDGGVLRIEVDEWAIAGAGALDRAEDGAPGDVRIAVIDNGTGIDPLTMERLFEPFFTTKPPGEGTGLGLATVYGIVEQSGGWMAVESEPGSGSSFTVGLPWVHGEVEAAPALPVDPERRADAGELVLLVEDERAVRELARRVLEKRGYRVVSAESGTAALDVLRAMPTPPDLLVTDMVMPGLDGRELAEEVRRLHPSCRVLLISGYTEDMVVRKGTLPPDTGFLEKPFTPVQLIERIEFLLRAVAG